MSDAPKRYVGKGKEFGQYGQISISVCLDDLEQTDVNEYKGKKYIRLIVGKMKNKDEHGKTHTVWVDDWKPDQNYRKPSGALPVGATHSVESQEQQINVDDIPF